MYAMYVCALLSGDAHQEHWHP